jgi:hypothetical protein
MTASEYEKLTRYLCKLYSVDGFIRHSIQHPLVVYAPDAEQINDVDSVIGNLRPAPATPFAIYDYGYLHSLQNSGRNIFNGTTFGLHYIETSPLKIHGQYGTYYDMLATCGALENELKADWGNQPLQLPLRSQLHRTLTLSQAMWNGAGRSATIGGACLVVFNHEGDYKAILARRSAKNATDPNFYHVLPAFIFQPTQTTFHPIEWTFSHHVYREFLEELFGVAESDSAQPDWIYGHSALQDLQAMMRRGEASLHVTGIVLNLFTLRPEICTLLLIHDVEWWRRIHDPHNDYHLNADSEAQDGQIACVPIISDEALLAGLPQNLHTMMPPQGFTALWLGVDLARELLKG